MSWLTAPSSVLINTARVLKKAEAGQALGRSKGGLSTKIYATLDALGNPTGFLLTPGQACDLEGADVLLSALDAPIVMADKGYDADQRVLYPLAQFNSRSQPENIVQLCRRQSDSADWLRRHDLSGNDPLCASAV